METVVGDKGLCSSGLLCSIGLLFGLCMYRLVVTWKSGSGCGEGQVPGQARLVGLCDGLMMMLRPRCHLVDCFVNHLLSCVQQARFIRC